MQSFIFRHKSNGARIKDGRDIFRITNHDDGTQTVEADVDGENWSEILVDVIEGQSKPDPDPSPDPTPDPDPAPDPTPEPDPTPQPVPSPVEAFTVRNSSDLYGALDAARAGQAIRVKPGSYGDFTFRRNVGDGFVTMNFDDGADFSKVTMSGARGLDFNGIKFSATGIWSNSSRLKLRNATNRSFTICRQVSDVEVKHSKFTGSGKFHWETAGGAPCHGWKIHANLFQMNDGAQRSFDFLEGQGVYDMEIVDNTFDDLWIKYNSGTSGSYAHVDFMQFYSNQGHEPRNILLQGNVVRDDARTQQKAALWIMTLNISGRDHKIRNNILMGMSPNGLFMSNDMAGTVVEGNLCLPSPGAVGVSSLGGNIVMHSTTSNHPTIRNNACGAIVDQTGRGAWDGGGNVTGVSLADFDMTHGGAAITDFVPKPGSRADVRQGWRDRLDGILNGTQDFYAPDGKLQPAA